MHESTTNVMPRGGPVDGAIEVRTGLSPAAGSTAANGPSGQIGSEPQAVAAVLAIQARAGARGAGFTGLGYLTEAAGVQWSDLFAADAAEVAGSLFTVYLDGSIVQSGSGAVLGELTVFQRRTPGAAFGDLSSFTDGHVVAAYDLTLHGPFDLRGPAVTGLLVQTHAGRLDAGLRGLRFGRRGERLRVVVSETGDADMVDSPDSVQRRVGAPARNTQWMLATALPAAA